jgi:diguanylate cyclase (GGDEF)-like protein
MNKYWQLLYLIIFAPSLLATPLAVFDDPQKRIDINASVQYSLSNSPELSGDEKWQNERFEDTQIKPEQFLHFRVQIKNVMSTDQQVWLTFEFPSIEKLTISDGIHTWNTGDARPYNTRPIDAPNYHFPLQLRTQETIEVYGHMQGKILRYSFELITPALASETYRKTLQLDMMFFGAMTLLLIVAIIMFMVTKQLIFLSFAAFVFAVQAWLFRVYGYGFELLWPNLPKLNDITYAVSVYAVMLSAVWMFLSSLSSRKKLVKRGWILIWYSFALPIVGFFAYATDNLKFALDLPLIWFFPFNLLLTIIVLLELKAGSKKAKWFVISMLPVIVGGLILVAFALGVDIGIAPKAALMKGLLLTCFLLIFSTGTYLLRVLRDDRDRQKQQSELNSKQAKKLEELVKERTAELENSNQQLKDLAHIDSLTQLPNRRSIDLFVDKLNDDCAPICLAMLDLDHFKKINDTYGHDVGDLVLQEVGKLFKEFKNGNTIAGRYGGEEFAIVSKNTVPQDFETSLKSLHAYINTTTIARYPALKIGACIGWVACDKAEQIIEAFKQADQALYEGKQKGRNKVIKYSLE